ncbi:lateral signaling target protein 2 homolog [Cimex lectularius]|uniref:Lateral signaling target protein 2 homolog n=1 Tax=Cimex lectularius TaxID=79782 RepID=A0A8I6TBR7_CIMLE|nr:lateral signaling target protein 2 homolog [Cimex lectularius]
MSSIMESLRKWFYKPRKDDTSHLAQFFYADEALNLVAAELDSFDGRKDPERCSSLVNHLRQCQDKVLNICNKIMDEMIPNERADRDFRVKFPDDVMQDNLAGQLWFGAECLAAGSSIMNREAESSMMRPLAKALTKALDNVRGLLREAALRSHSTPVSEIQTDKLTESLKVFDRLLADFELAYVSAMVPVKSVQEYELQQCVIVLFSETLHRALKMGLLTQEMVDQYDPALMFTIPRLAIVTGLVIFPHGPLSLSFTQPISDMFKPFKTLLIRIRELLRTLTEEELLTLEKMLSSSEELIFSEDCEKIENLKRTKDNEETDKWSNKHECIEGREELPAEIMDGRLQNREVQQPVVEIIENSPLPPNEMQHSPHDSGFVQSNSDGSLSEAARGSGEEVTNRCQDILTSNFNSYTKNLPNKNISGTLDDNWGEASFRRNYDENWDSLAEMQTNSQDISSNHTEGDNTAGSSYSSSCSSCQSPLSNCASSDTSSYNSDCQDDIEVALALKAAELRTSQEARAKFRSSADLVHRLFVCVAGVADQLQTNFAGDLRNILKSVFLMNASDRGEYGTVNDENIECCERGEDAVEWGERETQPAPSWVPDQAAPSCMYCTSPFTVVRRRHHCRNCGKVFCARCSSNSVPLPRYGHLKPVRVCNRCFIYQVTPFSLETNIRTAN